MKSAAGYKCPICKYQSMSQHLVSLHVHRTHNRELIRNFLSLSLILTSIQYFSKSVRNRNTQLPGFFTAVIRYWYGMPKEAFNEMLMRGFENEHFTPQNVHETNIVRMSQLRIRGRKREEDVLQSQCQVDEEINIVLESQSRLTEKG